MNESKANENYSSGKSEEHKEYLVERILDHRFTREARPEFLVHWKGYPLEEASWVPLVNVLGNQQFEEYREALPEDIRRNIRVPQNHPIGGDEDGLCFRRAITELGLSDVDVELFRPWIPLQEGLNLLRHHEYSVRTLRKKNPTKGKKLLRLTGAHIEGFCKKKGYRRRKAKDYRVFVVTKLTRPRSLKASRGRFSGKTE